VSALVVEEVSGNFLVELLEEVRVVLEDFLDIFSRELPNSLSPILNIYNVIDFKLHVELLDPLPLTHDEKDEYNYNLLSCVQFLLTQVLDSIYFIPPS